MGINKTIPTETKATTTTTTRWNPSTVRNGTTPNQISIRTTSEWEELDFPPLQHTIDSWINKTARRHLFAYPKIGQHNNNPSSIR